MAKSEVFVSSNRQYTNEFKSEAVKQVIERGFTVVGVAARIGGPKHMLYGWVQSTRKAARTSPATRPAGDSAEIRRLKAELKRVSDRITRLPPDSGLSLECAIPYPVEAVLRCRGEILADTIGTANAHRFQQGTR